MLLIGNVFKDETGDYVADSEYFEFIAKVFRWLIKSIIKEGNIYYIHI